MPAAVTAANLDLWKTSRTRAEIHGFVISLAQSVGGLSTDAAPPTCCAVGASVVRILDRLEEHISHFPPINQPMRYGNTAFRGWHAWVLAYLNGGALLLSEGVLRPDQSDVAPELALHVADSFGNPTRIDYGTGHELSWTCFLLSLFKLHRLSASVDSEPDDRAPTVLVVFKRYVELCRRLQTTYKLEPAGSRGVWGLDDYCLLPFLFGAAQYASWSGARPAPPPDAILSAERCATGAAENMLLDAVVFVRQVKGPGVHVHSPVLSDLARLPSWDRVLRRLAHMFAAEVLDRLPVVQHLRLGTVIAWPDDDAVGPKNVERPMV